MMGRESTFGVSAEYECENGHKYQSASWAYATACYKCNAPFKHIKVDLAPERCETCGALGERQPDGTQRMVHKDTCDPWYLR